MKLDVKSITNTKIKQIDLPSQFSESYRPDLIKRAVHAIQSHKRQSYGADPEAGKKVSAELSRRRHDYRGSYGIGISRVPRKIMSRRGTRMNWVGALAPGTVGGRRAHPPKSQKESDKKINTKERRKAIRSALAATLLKDIAQARGHLIPIDYPFILEEKIESVDKTKDLKKILEALGLTDELARTDVKNIRAGKAKSRGRKYKIKTGPLLVVSKNCQLLKAGSNILGVDVIEVDKLNAELLAPGADAGRLTLFSETAIARIEKEKLFTDSPAVKRQESKKKKVPVKRGKKKQADKKIKIKKKKTQIIKEKPKERPQAEAKIE